MLRCGVLMFLFLIMAQTKAGVIKVISKKLGISVEEYTQKVNSGLKNCFRCGQWLSLDNFPSEEVDTMAKTLAARNAKMLTVGQSIREFRSLRASKNASYRGTAHRIP